MSTCHVSSGSATMESCIVVLSTCTDHVQPILSTAAVQLSTAVPAYRLPGADLVISCKRELA